MKTRCKAFRPFLPRAFTLVELLAVIAIIALLVSLLLPALRKARLEAWKAMSLANVRSLGQAGAAYQNDQRGYLPIVPTGVPVPEVIRSVITWGGWGKHTSSWWSGNGGIFDIAPASRPLNPYLFDGHMPSEKDDETRKVFHMPMLKDPSDKIGHQRNWNAYEPVFGTVVQNTDGSSCYDDVGTSYLLQIKWFLQAATNVSGLNTATKWTKGWRLGTERIRLADSFQPSRMIWINDEWCDITMNQIWSTAKIKNGYGDINKACVGFLDGHARYLKIIPGGEGDINASTKPWLVPAYNNGEYTVVFPDLRR